MPARRLQPPRRLLGAFVAVALASAGALGWLGWLLLRQDAALDVQRQQDRVEQAADRAAAAMQRSIVDLQARVGSPAATLPAGVVSISITASGITASPAGAVLYYPTRAPEEPLPASTFSDGERLEFAASNPRGAGDEYLRLAAARDARIRAAALMRLARARRKAADPDGALRAYDDLARLDPVTIDGLPASLVARTGRGSVFDETHQTAALGTEAAALLRDLASGRWHLLEAEYDFYASQAAAWLGTKPPSDTNAQVRTEAAAWLWRNRQSLESSRRRSLTLSSGEALVAWQAAGEKASAVVAGPDYLKSLCADAVPDGFLCSLGDADGRVVAGERTAPSHTSTMRPASASGVPWMLHVSMAPGSEKATTSPRRRLLILAFTVVALVLAAGWYFILRAMSREVRLARLQSDFVAAVSHEFRSPLTSLSHVANLLADDRIGSDELRRRSYDVLVRESDRLRRLVEGLLDFGRFEAGAASLRMERIDVAALVRTTVSDFRERARADGYAIELDAPGDAIYAPADHDALSRALWNLLDNAVKYSPDCKTVWVDMRCDDGRIAIAVRDQGLGIPANEQREIFDRFVRGAESTHRRVRGTGIGLALVRDIVRAHGGEIQLTSEPGRGSRFTMVLRTAAGGIA
jgi:signal transduction histidine kinase